MIATTRRPPRKSLNRADHGRLVKRAEELASHPIDFIDNPEFHKRNAEQRILADGETKDSGTRRRRNRRPDNVPAYFAALYETPLLTASEEVDLFRRFNFMKYKAEKLRSRIKVKRPSAKRLDELEAALASAHAAWEQLVQANLRLVVSIARRFVDAGQTLDDLVSDGQIALMNAIEKFDFARGFRFSTYATHAIQRSFYRRVKKRQREASRIWTAGAEVMEDLPDRWHNDEVNAEDFSRLQHVMGWIDDALDEREKLILSARFGMNEDQESRTLRNIGQDLGISKERVRQIQIQAIEKLKQLAGTAEDPSDAAAQ